MLKHKVATVTTSNTAGPGSQVARRTVHVFLAGAGYGLCALVGTVLSLPPSNFAIVWPATAFLTAVLLVSPVRNWWTFVLGVAPAHFLLIEALDSQVSLSVALIQVSGNLSLAAATAATLRRASDGPPRFDSFRGVLVFLILAGVAVPAVVNALILGLHLGMGSTQDFWLSWRQWMLASVFPTLTLVPLATLVMRQELFDEISPRRRLEPLLLCPLLYALSFLVFGGGMEAEYWPALLLAPLPLLLWAAVRWGVGGASLALVVFAGAVIVQALHGLGPFAAQSSAASIQSLQVYLTAITVPLLLLAALMQERGRTEDLLRRSEARIEIAAASTDTGLWQWDEASQELWMTGHCRAMFGLEPGAGLRPQDFLDAVHPEDRARVSAALHMALTSGDVETLGAFGVVRGEEARLYILRTHAERDRDGRLIRVSGVFRDATQRIGAQRQAEQLTRRLLTLQEDERKSIAEELHDSTGQHLTGASLLVQMLRRRVSPATEAGGLLNDLQASLDAAAREVRTFTYLLRPPELDRYGLCEVLRRYVEGFGRRTGIQVRVRMTPRADGLPMEQQRAILRITQESLANVYRHAQASRVSVRLRRDGQSLHLLIRDNGRGIRPAARGARGDATNLGVGIPGMTARVGLLSGRIAIRSRARGTTVHVALPMPDVPPRSGRKVAAGRRRALA